MTDRSSDSVNTCRNTRSRPAPSATRIAISRWREAPRASNSPATFVQAISRRTATTAISIRRGRANRSRKAEKPALAGSTSIWA